MMDKFPNSCDKEYMKMAMLKHEEMFREQVYELHRLYRVQTLLMNNISRNKENEIKTHDRLWIKSSHENISMYSHYIHHQPPRQKLIDLEQPPAQEENNANLDRNGGLEVEDECDIELTLGPSSYNHPTRKAKTPLTSDSGLSFSSSSTGSSSAKRRDNSDGFRRIPDKITKKELTAHNWGLVEVPTSSSPSNFLNGRKMGTNDSEQLRQDRLQQPPWLFQVLSMNIT